jgi:Dyp-type peroxidase family
LTVAQAVVEQHDLQGNVLAGYGNDFAHALFAFVRISDAAIGRSWLGDLAGRVTNAVPWDNKPADTLNIALTADGLRALDVPTAVLDSFPQEFREGMGTAERAGLLGDRGPSAPERWERGLRQGDFNALVTISAQQADVLDRRRDDLLVQIADSGGALELAHRETPSLMRNPEDGETIVREHFGFADGLAQPSIDAQGLERGSKAGPNARLGQGTPLKGDGWADLAPGEFVLGYAGEDGSLPEAPVDPLGRNGSFMVVRKLHQDVALFTRFLRRAAGGDRDRAELLAAKIVGRWKDGTPLVQSPERPPPGRPNDPERVAQINNFRYEGDLGGRRCPLGAHVRRANPRDAFGWEGMLAKRHRIIRRGMPYGQPPADPAVEDNQQRGLMFVCYQASIERQFEVIQAHWLNDGDAFGLGGEKDFLLSDEDPRGIMSLPGCTPRFLKPRPSFVTLRGGGYLFTPGLAALRALAAGI